MTPSTPLGTGPATPTGSAARPRTRGWLAPTPPSVAIEIASRRVTVVGLAAASGQPVIGGFATETLPPEAVVPALSGVNIADPGIVADAVRRACERAGLGSPRRAALIVPDSVARVSLLRFEQVPAKPADLDQLIRWQLRKATPFPLEEARLDHVRASSDESGTTFAAIVARRDVLAQYEAVASAARIHAGVVDLASFNVMNTVMAVPEGSRGARLLVHLAHEATTIAILRETSLLFYRHRMAIDEEPLTALVHQTAMFHEDRLGGGRFERVWLSGAALADGPAGSARAELGESLGVPVETVDVRRAASFRNAASDAGALDALAAPAGALLREYEA